MGSRRWWYALSLLGALVLIGSLAPAQQAAKTDPDKLFTFADANKDGKLSRAEFRKLVANNPRFKENPRLSDIVFARLDGDRNDTLSKEEFREIAKLRRGGADKTEEKPAKSVGDKPATADGLAFFEKKIRPVFVQHCYKCHSAKSEKVRGGLVLDTRDGIRKGGDTGPAVVPGDVRKSLLVKALRHTSDTLKMPPKQKLSDEIIADFEKWIVMGAPDPRDGSPAPPKVVIDIDKGRRFWSFQPPRKPAVPNVKDRAWARSDIDRFLLSTMEAKGVKPVADADPHALVRRLHFDLIGLPPTPEQVDAFVKSYRSRPGGQSAVEKLVDELLASKHFGERWGRHWLDVARYAESSGRQVNFTYPHAWRYRDYVIAAFNADRPYDQFIREQLAGDLLPADSDARKAELLIATGFLAMVPKNHNERNRLQFQLDVVDEQIDGTFVAFQGLTVSCARCHDHKFDPIPQRDYYAIAAIFRSTRSLHGTIRVIQNAQSASLVTLPAGSNAPLALAKLSSREKSQLEERLSEAKKSRDEAFRNRASNINRFVLSTIQVATLQGRLDLYNSDGTPRALAMGVRDSFAATDSPLYVRGEPDKPGDVVPRGFLQVLSTKEKRISRRGSGRKELADWIASADNPLTARVMVNRVWLHLFGRGLVATPDNFGAAGQPPSHPELLDWLAVTFVEDGWSIKKLIRRIVLTRAYQLSTRHDANNHELDPDNVLVWRMSKRRLDAESIRDAMLAVSGQLDRTPPVGSLVAQVGDGFANRVRFRLTGFETSDRHRSVYMPIVRDLLPEALSVFDFADPTTVTGERPVTTVPAQALYLLNSPFVMRQSEAAAAVLLEGQATDEERLARAYQRFFGRQATQREIDRAMDFLTRYAKEHKLPRQGRRAAWGALCQAFFASADFLYLN